MSGNETFHCLQGSYTINDENYQILSVIRKAEILLCGQIAQLWDILWETKASPESLVMTQWKILMLTGKYQRLLSRTNQAHKCLPRKERNCARTENPNSYAWHPGVGVSHLVILAVILCSHYLAAWLVQKYVLLNIK